MIASFVRKGLVSLFLALCGAFPLIPRLQASQDITAFVHLNALPMDREQILKDQTVVVRRDRIHEIGPSGSIGVPTEATVIDGARKFLMPGLCDMHTHFFDEGDLLLFVANGVTTVRNLHGYPMHLVWREQARRGERIGPKRVFKISALNHLTIFGCGRRVALCKVVLYSKQLESSFTGLGQEDELRLTL